MGLLQNAVEESGISTVSLSMAPTITQVTGVPRALYVRFPFGDPFGEPGDAATQRAILLAALQWLYDAPGPSQLHRLRVNWRRSKRPAAPRTSPPASSGD